MTKDEILTMKAGPELDALIAEKVFGLSLEGKPKAYSTDIRAAWEVVEMIVGKKCDEHDLFIECWSDREWFVAFHPTGYSSRDPKASCDGRETGIPSLPLAICRAAMLASELGNA